MRNPAGATGCSPDKVRYLDGTGALTRNVNPWSGLACGWTGVLLNRPIVGVKAVALAADPVTGGYWILRSDGGVGSYNAPWYGSMAGQTVTGITGE